MLQNIESAIQEKNHNSSDYESGIWKKNYAMEVKKNINFKFFGSKTLIKTSAKAKTLQF